MKLSTIGLVVFLIILLAGLLIQTLGTTANKTFSSSLPQREARALQQDKVNDAGKGAVKGQEFARIQPAGNGAGAAEPKPAPLDAQARKIIFTAQVQLIVEEFDKAEKEIMDLVKAQKAYVAKSDLSGSPGTRRAGSWTVRVPVDHFNDFIDGLAPLGELQRRNTDSEDITDKYADFETRIKNMKTRETRLRAYLEDKKLTAKLEDIFNVERELNRVRDEIEQLQGLLNKWDKLVALATVVLTIQERKDYVPPPPVAASFATTIARTFQSSVDLLIGLGKALLLVVVALAPWLPMLAIVAVPTWLIARRQWRTSAVPAGRQAPGGPVSPGNLT